MKRYFFPIILFLSGCASEPPKLPQALDVHGAEIRVEMNDTLVGKHYFTFDGKSALPKPWQFKVTHGLSCSRFSVAPNLIVTERSVYVQIDQYACGNASLVESRKYKFNYLNGSTWNSTNLDNPFNGKIEVLWAVGKLQ